MPPIENARESACTFEETVRAARCEGCLAANRGVTPCLAAFLRGESRLVESNVVSLRHVLALRAA